jgi:hypothetical protein
MSLPAVGRVGQEEPTHCTMFDLLSLTPPRPSAPRNSGFAMVLNTDFIAVGGMRIDDNDDYEGLTR